MRFAIGDVAFAGLGLAGARYGLRMGCWASPD